MMKRIAALAAPLMLLSACSTTSTISVLESKYQTDQPACQVTFFKKAKPDREFETLAQIESHVQRNVFFGGDAKLEDQAYAELKTKTCNLGGNAVIINDYVESRAAEFSHVHVWATTVKLL
ncbi:hypothetical protein [Rugamonas rivuli]|uniref:Lipoprotein n=1 Tax=Rugamonas rivuli TaxID=2743358 RepID=A0A843SMR2_9BURK|nr:hypothetical protein [Rugamonas rivuli]MQA21576.1 hypothetical protein [Rugamonas rivuli]